MLPGDTRLTDGSILFESDNPTTVLDRSLRVRVLENDDQKLDLYVKEGEVEFIVTTLDHEQLGCFLGTLYTAHRMMHERLTERGDRHV